MLGMLLALGSTTIPLALPAGPDPVAQVRVDASRREVVVTIGPFHVPNMPAGMDHAQMTMMSDGPSTHATQPGSTRGNQQMDGEQCKFGVGCLAQGAPVPAPPIAVAMPMDFSTVTHSVAMSGRLPSLVRAPHLRPPIAT